jgi:2-keto-4-pentenoate hydratase
MKKLAIRQLKDYESQNPGTCFLKSNFKIDVKSAYKLQGEVTKLRILKGEKIIGYKVGCTGTGTIAQFGMEGPIRGTLFEGEVFQDRSIINYDIFAHPAVEAEMAIKLDSMGQIGSVFPVIELHNYIFRGKTKTLSELIANNGLNAGVVFPNKAWWKLQKIDNKKEVLSLKINDTIVDQGKLWPQLGGPEISVSWLRKHLNDYNVSLNPGHIVLAGTELGLYPIKQGDRVDVLIDGKQAVNCKII